MGSCIPYMGVVVSEPGWDKHTWGKEGGIDICLGDVSGVGKCVRKAHVLL